MPPKKKQQSAISQPIPGLKVFGNYFVPEMRTTCALLDLNEVTYTAEDLDIFSQHGRNEYLKLNPGE